MDEQDKISKQLAALDAAEGALPGGDPTSDYVHDQIERLISSLQLRLLALSTAVVIPALSTTEIDSLQTALTALSVATQQSAGTVEILQAATSLASA